MDNDKLLNFVSRFVIIVPVIIIILALIFKPSQKDYKKEIITITPKINVQNTNFNLTKINLNGEYTCDFSIKEATQTAYIKNKKIFVENFNSQKKEVINFLFSGDCLYNWNKGDYSGEKLCGLSSYVLTAEKLLGTGLIDIKSIVKKFTETNNILGKEKTDLDFKDIKCKEGITQKNISFEVPKNILFKNKNLQ